MSNSRSQRISFRFLPLSVISRMAVLVFLSSAIPARAEQGSSGTALAVSAGGGYWPNLTGNSGGAATLEVDLALKTSDRFGFRIGLIGAYEMTSYQSSVIGFLVLRQYYYPGGSIYGFGGSVGAGYGMFSPQNGRHADDGGSPVLMATATPVTLRFGARRDFEISMQVGFVNLVSFGQELDPFYQVSFGFVTW
jgi:hypothetical protein